MHPLSINYITREKSDYAQYDYCLRETPYPGDSGVDCSNVSNSQQTCESPNDQTTKSAARVSCFTCNAFVFCAENSPVNGILGCHRDGRLTGHVPML